MTTHRRVLAFFCLQCFGLLAALAPLGAAHADKADSRRNHATEESFAAPLEAISPGLGAEFAKATELMDERQTASSKIAFVAVLSKAPAHAPTLWRLSSLSAIEQNKKDALQYARQALQAQTVWQTKLTLAGTT